jgi:adenylyltransferase/sulfurtransferase
VSSSNPANAKLDPREIARYGRHLVLPEVGVEGQQRLRAASVLLVGAGGLGSPLALYLAAAGVGRIGLVDFDTVDLSNLQRQILYGTADVGRSKLSVATARLDDVNPHVTVQPHETRLTAANAREILSDYDIVADGTDNFSTRYLVNDACVLLGKPNVHGSIFRFEGQVSLFWPGRGPCYRCLFPEPPAPGTVPDCAEGGVLGVLAGIIGTLQATETIKWILERGETLCGRLLLFDALQMRFRELELRRDPECPVCGDHPTIRDLHDGATFCAPLPEAASASSDIEPSELRRRLAEPGPPLLLDVRGRHEWSICHLPGALLIPVQELEDRLDVIAREREIVVYCHYGLWSARAAALLRRHGYASVRNLTGGIDAWAATVDPEMPRY